MASSVLAKMAVVISAETSKFSKQVGGIEGQLSKFTNGLKGIAATIGIAFGLKEITQFAFAVSKLAGEADGVKAAFDKLPESKKLLDELTAATAGTVSELDLMKRAVQAQNFGIALEALPDLLKFAALRAQQTGQSVDYLVDSIVTGIGRKSPLILDNLGISAVRLKGQFGGAALEAQSIGDVAKAVGRIASEELTKMGDFSENASTKIQRLNSSWENFKVAVGRAANETGILNSVLDKTTELLDIIAGKKDLSAGTDLLTRAIASNAAPENIQVVVDALKELRKQTGKPLEFQSEELIQNYKLTGEQADVLRSKIIEINDALSFQERTIKQFNDFSKRNGYKDLSKASTDYINRLYELILQQQIEFEQNKKNTASIELLRGVRDKNIKTLRDQIAILNTYSKTLVTVDDKQKSSITTIDTLQEKLKGLNDQFENTDIADKKHLQSLGSEIIVTQALIDKIDKLRKKREAVAKADLAIKNSNLFGVVKNLDFGQKSPDLIRELQGNAYQTGRASNAAGIAQFAELPITGKDLSKDLGLDKSLQKQVTDALANYSDAIDKFKNKNQTVTAEVGKVWIDLSGIIASGVSDVAFSLGQSAAGIGNFGDNILKALVGFAKQFGEILISIGVAALAATKLAIAPQTAIIAGVALVALAGAASVALNKSQQNYNSGGGGSVSSGRSSSVSQGFSGRGDFQDSTSLTGLIRGQDLLVVLQKANNNNGYTKG